MLYNMSLAGVRVVEFGTNAGVGFNAMCDVIYHGKLKAANIFIRKLRCATFSNYYHKKKLSTSSTSGIN